MRRGGFDDNQVCFVSGHKDARSLQNYDALTVFDKTKIAIAMQHAPTTLDGGEINLDALARRNKRKADEEHLGERTSKRQNNDAPLYHVVVNSSNDSGLGGSETSSIPPSPVTSKNDQVAAVNHEEASEVVMSQNDGHGMPKFILSDNHADHEHEHTPLGQADSQPEATQRAITSSQGNNVSQLIHDHITSSERLINNYLSAMQKKKKN